MYLFVLLLLHGLLDVVEHLIRVPAPQVHLRRPRPPLSLTSRNLRIPHRQNPAATAQKDMASRTFRRLNLPSPQRQPSTDKKKRERGSVRPPLSFSPPSTFGFPTSETQQRLQKRRARG